MVVLKVLIIEDDDVIARGMASHLNAAGFDPLWVNKGEAASRGCAAKRTSACSTSCCPAWTAGV